MPDYTAGRRPNVLRVAPLRRLPSQQLLQDRRTVLPKDQDDAHERAAGDDAGCDREQVFLALLRVPLLPALPDQGAEEEKQAVEPLEHPGQSDARR